MGLQTNLNAPRPGRKWRGDGYGVVSRSRVRRGMPANALALVAQASARGEAPNPRDAWRSIVK